MIEITHGLNVKGPGTSNRANIGEKNTGSSVELQIERKTVEKGPSYKYLSQNQGTGTA